MSENRCSGPLIGLLSGPLSGPSSGPLSGPSGPSSGPLEWSIWTKAVAVVCSPPLVGPSREVSETAKGTKGMSTSRHTSYCTCVESEKQRKPHDHRPRLGADLAHCFHARLHMKMVG
jgi:hypothetical protein